MRFAVMRSAPVGGDTAPERVARRVLARAGASARPATPMNLPIVAPGF